MNLLKFPAIVNLWKAPVFSLFTFTIYSSRHTSTASPIIAGPFCTSTISTFCVRGNRVTSVPETFGRVLIYSFQRPLYEASFNESTSDLKGEKRVATAAPKFLPTFLPSFVVNIFVCQSRTTLIHIKAGAHFLDKIYRSSILW